MYYCCGYKSACTLYVNNYYVCTDTPGQPLFLIFFTSTKVLKEGPKWEMKDQVLFQEGEEKEKKSSTLLRGDRQDDD